MNVGMLGVRPVIQLQDRAVMRVGGAEKDVLDAGGVFDFSSNGLSRLPGWRSTQAGPPMPIVKAAVA